MTSVDGKSWNTYADKTDNTKAGSPMIEEGETKSRFVRIYITDTQKNGHMPAIWNVKVFNAGKKNNPKNLLPDTDGMDMKAVEEGYPTLHKKDVSEADRMASAEKGHLIIDINADDYNKDGFANIARILNRQGGYFDCKSGKMRVEVKSGKNGFFFNGKH